MKGDIGLNFKKELDLALKPIVSLPVELQNIVAEDIIATIRSRIETMQAIAAKTQP